MYSFSAPATSQTAFLLWRISMVVHHEDHCIQLISNEQFGLLLDAFLDELRRICAGLFIF
jgi:hypothetical protein